MDESLRHFNPNPTLSANIISKVFFWWVNPLFKKGRKQELVIEDLYNVAPQDSSDHLGTALEKEWLKELKKTEDKGGTSKPSLLKAMVRVFGLRYMMLGLIVFCEESVRVVQPLLLGGLIGYFTPNSAVTRTEAFLYALGVSLCTIFIGIIHHPYFFAAKRMGMQMRVACCSLMFKKALRLSNTAMGQTTTGQIVNLMSNDVNRFDLGVIFLHFLWIGPLQAIAVLIILWYRLGPTVLAGFAVLLLLAPVQAGMGKLFTKLRHKTAAHTDERVKVMNEIITGMRVIKMYCWEKPFGKLVEKLRRCELHFVWAKKRVNAFTSSVWVFAHRVLTYALVVTHMLGGGSLRAGPLYMAVSFMFLLAYNGVGCVFEGVSRFSEFYVASTRIQALDQNTLEQVSATIQAGQLLAVIGPVGAGKSSLLMAVLGELQASSGSISVKGKVAYVSQQAWVFSGSLRQNVICGSSYDKGRFDKVVRASAMRKDLEIMPHGDSTLIGDRGVSLSGGQRARVSLARALYKDADIFLLDDPLSAVDAAVGRHIFSKCIQGVLRKKPRILVTHQLQYLTDADSILILKEGKVMGMGTYEELSKSGIDFSELLKTNEEEEEEVAQPVLSAADHLLQPAVSYSSQMSLVSASSDLEPEPVQLPEEEERQKGTVGWKVYMDYFRAGAGILRFLLMALVCMVAQCSYIMSDWWLSRWTVAEEDRLAATKEHQHLLSQGYNHTNVTIPVIDGARNIYVFSALILGVFTFGMLRALLFFRVTVNASRTLHNRMFARILRCPISFFDTNPVGRILNRFAKDVGHMDDNLPLTFFDFVQCLLLILGIVLVACVVNPVVFIPTLPIVLLFFYIRSYYLSTARSIKRLEGTCRSPVFSYLSAALQGLPTIRAFGLQDKFQEEFDSLQDLHTETWFLFLASSRWLSSRLDGLCASFITVVSFCAVLSAGSLDAGLVGLSITYSMTLMGIFQWTVRQSAEVENQMISVERVLEYSQLPSEAALESQQGAHPPDDWPRTGSIQADGLCLRYSHNAPIVLKNLSFSIKDKEKVGIVGRTGAGKSSLITCLFRLVEPSGHLYIDGVNIQQLGLHDVRSIISIIPQDPVLFTGTLRKNLDPFLQHGDLQLWKALAEVQLKSAVEELPCGLETLVAEGGINFSVGQRQLICLARAILRKNRILLIDEATANVDPRTDELIQDTIRDKFSECTVLTIAHRLHTIMDSDRVMVLSEGQIMEFEPPHILLQRGCGLFYDMVQQTGKTEAEQLAEMAADAYSRRQLDKRSCSSGVESLAQPETAETDSLLCSHDTKLVQEGLAAGEAVNMPAPLALAESFHSLLKGQHGEAGDDDDDDDDDGDDVCSDGGDEEEENTELEEVKKLRGSDGHAKFHC